VRGVSGWPRRDGAAAGRDGAVGARGRRPTACRTSAQRRGDRDAGRRHPATRRPHAHRAAADSRLGGRAGRAAGGHWQALAPPPGGTGDTLIMPLSRGRRYEPVNYWPGFVDALSTMLLVIIFLLSVFMLAQFFLSREVTGKDEALVRLQRQIEE